MTWGKPADYEPPAEISDQKVLLRIFLTFHGSKIILLFHGYDKGKDPSQRRQQKEIKKARKALAWLYRVFNVRDAGSSLVAAPQPSANRPVATDRA